MLACRGLVTRTACVNSATGRQGCRAGIWDAHDPAALMAAAREVLAQWRGATDTARVDGFCRCVVDLIAIDGLQHEDRFLCLQASGLGVEFDSLNALADEHRAPGQGVIEDDALLFTVRDARSADPPERIGGLVGVVAAHPSLLGEPGLVVAGVLVSTRR